MPRLGTDGAIEVLAKARQPQAEGTHIVRMGLDELASLFTPKTRMLIINTPQNPTGGVLTEEDVDFVCDLAHKHDLLVVSDEIYSQLVYGFHHVSPLSGPGMRERTVLMDGLSLIYAMTDLRLA